MTQDEIYEMAHQAGVENEFNYDFRLSIETFAKLVAAKAIAELESQEPVGVMVSMDVSKGDEPEYRIFGRIYEVLRDGDGEDELTYLAIEESRNFEATPPQPEPEPWCMKMNGCKTKCEDCPDESPQRTWVGLAAEDRLTAKYMQDAPDGIEAVIDYIEGKLKEKNT
jgi:hypothetical protein